MEGALCEAQLHGAPYVAESSSARKRTRPRFVPAGGRHCSTTTNSSHGGSGSGGSGESPPDMDAAIWSELPEDILDRILAWLNHVKFMTMFSARLVCHRWKSLVFSDALLEIINGAPSREKLFLLFAYKLPRKVHEPNICSVFNMDTCRWQSIPPFDYMPPHATYVEGTSGGLLLFSNACGDTFTLFVCNPITCQWRELPPMNHQRTPTLRHILADRSTNNYQIVVAGNASVRRHGGYEADRLRSFTDNSLQEEPEDFFYSTEVYDSRTGVWTVKHDIPKDTEVNWSAASWDSTLYCRADAIQWLPGVAMLDLNTGFWNDELILLPDFCELAQIVECSGRILAVGDTFRNGKVSSVWVMQLNVDEKTWSLISNLPRKLLQQFRRICDEDTFNCVVLDKRILFTSYTGIEVLVFDVTKRTWGWLPSCPRFLGREYSVIGFALEPNLTTKP